MAQNLHVIASAVRNIEERVNHHNNQTPNKLKPTDPTKVKRSFEFIIAKHSKYDSDLPDENPLAQIYKFGPNLIFDIHFPNSSLSVQIPWFADKPAEGKNASQQQPNNLKRM